MTAPLWLAAPPELHSTLLSTGPGPGPLLASAQAWNSLSAEYASAAEEISALLATVPAGTWDGPSAEEYLAAHVPYLAWLAQASTDAEVTATQHETVAAAYSTALATMPTLAELGANHAIHGVLLGTNFFGINTIPIAVNEADYVRMWVQASTTMATYQAVSTAAVAATPPSTTAPQILKADAPLAIQLPSPSNASNILSDIVDLPEEILQEIFKLFGANWDPIAGTFNGIPYLDYTNPLSLGYWITRDLLYLQNIQDFLQELTTNPLGLLQSLSSVSPATIAAYLSLHPVLAAAVIAGPLLSLASVPAAAAASVASVAAVAAIPFDTSAVPVVPAAPVTPAAPVAHAVHVSPVAAVASGAAPAPAAPAAAPAAPASAAPAPAAPPPPPSAAGFFPYAIVAPPDDPGIDFTENSGASAKASSPATSSAEVAAAEAARRASRRKRRRKSNLTDHANAYADLDPDWNTPDEQATPRTGTSASGQGAGPVGFTGTVAAEGVRAKGLTELRGELFDSEPAVPLVPNTWNPTESDGLAPR